MGGKAFTEQIIDTIKQHPILYDFKLPCRRELKEALWEEIADTFDLEVQLLKVKWKNLRDCYKKHIRAQTDDSKALSSYKYWQWSKYLEFLRPYLGSHRLIKTEVVYSNDTDDQNANEHSEIIRNIKPQEINHTNFDAAELLGKHTSNFGSDSDNFECIIEQPNRKKRRIAITENRNTVKSHNNRDVHGFDDVDLIFLGYAKNIKKMPLKRQISIKMKIAKIMMEEELKCLK